MNAQHPQWKDLPDSPGVWVLERESELAAMLGAKYAILDIKQCSLDRPTSRKYCVRAYGPIPTEAPAAQIIHTAEPIQFSQHDRQQLQIDQLIRDVKELNQKSIRSDVAYSSALSNLKHQIEHERAARKGLENALNHHADLIDNLREELKDCDEKIRWINLTPEGYPALPKEKPAPDITDAPTWNTESQIIKERASEIDPEHFM